MDDREIDQEASAALLQSEGEEITAIVLGMVQAAADRAGEPVGPHHLSEAIGLMLASAWTFAKLADDDSDGGRGVRYAELLRSHAGAVSKQ